MEEGTGIIYRISQTKLCLNPDCTIRNPEFYPSRYSFCKKCYNKKRNELQKQKQIQKLKDKDNEVDNLKRTIELLTSQLSQVQVKETSEDFCIDKDTENL